MKKCATTVLEVRDRPRRFVLFYFYTMSSQKIWAQKLRNIRFFVGALLAFLLAGTPPAEASAESARVIAVFTEIFLKSGLGATTLEGKSGTSAAALMVSRVEGTENLLTQIYVLDSERNVRKSETLIVELNEKQTEIRVFRDDLKEKGELFFEIARITLSGEKVLNRLKLRLKPGTTELQELAIWEKGSLGWKSGTSFFPL